MKSSGNGDGLQGTTRAPGASRGSGFWRLVRIDSSARIISYSNTTPPALSGDSFQFIQLGAPLGLHYPQVIWVCPCDVYLSTS